MKNIKNLLESCFGRLIAENLLSSYDDIVNKYSQSKWQESISASGKFAEIGVRAVECKLFQGKYLQFDKTLGGFDKLLAKYEKTKGDRSYRVLIPRVLRNIYAIRSTRGGAHVSSISPNRMDATLLLYSVKWVLAEMVRIESGFSADETASLVEAITERLTPLIWRKGQITRVLSNKITVKDKILLLLNHFPDSQTEVKLYTMTEYSNHSVFKKRIRELHRETLIHYDTQTGLCTISPTGEKQADQIQLKNNTDNS